MKLSQAAYGLTLNIHPGKHVKRVVLHALPCPSYTQKQPKGRNLYTFRKNCGSFSEAVAKLSE